MCAVVESDREKSGASDEDPNENESGAPVWKDSRSPTNFHLLGVFVGFPFRTLVSRLRFRASRSRSYMTVNTSSQMTCFLKINYLSVNEQNLTLDKNFDMVPRKVDASSPIARISEIARSLEFERRQHSVFKLDAFSFRSICKFFFE